MTTRRAVLLDLDGTLTDSAPGIVNCLRYALDAMGVDHPDDATIRTFLGPPLAVTFREHFAMSDADVDVAIAKYRERYHDIGLFENEVYDGIPELLTGLGAAGLPLAVATSKPTYSATRILEHFDLARHFAFIGGSDLEGTRHDKAAVIEHTMTELALLGLPSTSDDLVMVGDRRPRRAPAPVPTASTRWASCGGTGMPTSCWGPEPSRWRTHPPSCSSSWSRRTSRPGRLGIRWSLVTSTVQPAFTAVATCKASDRLVRPCSPRIRAASTKSARVWGPPASESGVRRTRRSGRRRSWSPRR